MDWPLDVVAVRLWAIEPGWVFGWALLFLSSANPYLLGEPIESRPAPAPAAPYVNWTC